MKPDMTAEEHLRQCAACNHGRTPCREYQQAWPISTHKATKARARMAAEDVLENCAAKYVAPESWYDVNPQQIVNQQIDIAERIISAYMGQGAEALAKELARKFGMHSSRVITEKDALRLIRAVMGP